MDTQLIAQEYQHKSDEELLRLAAEPQDLTPEAHEILKAELGSRGIAQDTLSEFRAQVEEEKTEAAKDLGKLFYVYHSGVGRTTFGKARRTYDPDTRIERFRTTVFIVLFWVPLIPRATYLVERKRGFPSNEMTVLERLPLDWEQVLQVWAVVSVCLVGFIWFVKFLPFILSRFR